MACSTCTFVLSRGVGISHGLLLSRSYHVRPSRVAWIPEPRHLGSDDLQHNFVWPPASYLRRPDGAASEPGIDRDPRVGESIRW